MQALFSDKSLEQKSKCSENKDVTTPLSRFLKKAGKTVMTSRFTNGSQNGEENELVDNYYSASCDAVDVCHANMFQVP